MNTSALGAEPSPHELVRTGNAALEKGEFEAALQAYREAEVARPESPELAFNQGVVYYRQRDFAKAREMFGKALATRDLALEARAKFNLGNCKYAEALERITDLQEAIDHLRSAIEHYVDVLEIAPDDQDARANIEMAQLLIKDLLDKLKNQQEQNPTSQPNQDQQQQEQQEQDQQQSGEEQQEEGEQQQGEEGQEEQEEQPSQGQPQDQQGHDDKEQQAQQQETRELTEQEAERLLQGVRDRERERRDEKARRIRAGRPRVVRDW